MQLCDTIYIMEKGKRFEGKENKEQIKKIIYGFLLIIFISILIYCLIILVKWYDDKKNNGKENVEINEITQVSEIVGGENVNPPKELNDDYWYYIKLPLTDVNIEELQKINKDTVGFINVSGTNINYPIVQTTDNSYYLKHSFKDELNNAGWIFMDYRSSVPNLGKNTIIYGHSRIDTTMFGSLKNILSSTWVNNKDNYIVRLTTLKEDTLWQVFSVYTIPTEDYYIKTSFSNDSEYDNWLKTMIGRSEYKFNTTVNVNDKVLTLSTCYNNLNTKRVVLQAKLIKRVER